MVEAATLLIRQLHFVILDTGPLASGEYPVQCVIEQNIPPEFVIMWISKKPTCMQLNSSITLLELKSKTQYYNVLV